MRKLMMKNEWREWINEWMISGRNEWINTEIESENKESRRRNYRKKQELTNTYFSIKVTF